MKGALCNTSLLCSVVNYLGESVGNFEHILEVITDELKSQEKIKQCTGHWKYVDTPPVFEQKMSQTDFSNLSKNEIN